MIPKEYQKSNFALELKAGKLEDLRVRWGPSRLLLSRICLAPLLDTGISHSSGRK